MKCFVIPVVIGAIGTVTTKYLEEIPGKHSIDSLKKKLPSWEHHTYYRKFYSLKLEA
jgi:hypothetical protein